MANKTLFILRHAKAIAGDAGMQDYERPLAERGRSDATACGMWLKAQELTPFILYSPAERTKETLSMLDVSLPQHADEALYLASAGDLLHELQKLDSVAECGDAAMLLGHNPGLHELVRILTGSAESQVREKVEWDFPTCACAVLHFSVARWADVTPGGGHLADAWLAKG